MTFVAWAASMAQSFGEVPYGITPCVQIEAINYDTGCHNGSGSTGLRRGCGDADQSTAANQSTDGHITCADGDIASGAWSADGDIAGCG